MKSTVYVLIYFLDPTGSLASIIILDAGDSTAFLPGSKAEHVASETRISRQELHHLRAGDF